MKKAPTFLLAVAAFGFLTAAVWAQVADNGAAPAKTAEPVASAPDTSGHKSIQLWEPLVSDKYATYEKIALVANVVVAIAGLAYALMLVSQVRNADQGT